jgi:DNA-binding IscR family transcriptional regulator
LTVDDYCDRIPTCASFEIWKEASRLLRDYFDAITLQDLIKIHDKKNAKGKAKSKAKGH